MTDQRSKSGRTIEEEVSKIQTKISDSKPKRILYGIRLGDVPGCSCPNHTSTRYLDSIYPLLITHNVDLSRLQSSNTVLLPCEADAVNDAILVAEQLLMQLRQHTTQLACSRDALMEQVTHMNSQIIALTQRCEETQVQIQEHRKVLSVVRRLPMEILQEIFFATVDFPSRMYWSSPTWSVDSSAPTISLWDIELVSKGWRSALLSCARAWSYIVIRDASLFDFGYSEVIRLGRQLQRAQNHPLSIFIHEPPGTSILSSHLIVCLIPFAHKIQTMHLGVSYNTIPRFCPIGPSLRSLHSLSITSNNTFVRSHLIVPDPFGDTFRDAGNLQYLELQDVYYARIALLSIPWRAITHLKIANQLKARFHHYTAPEDILEVLSIVTTIEDLELQISLVSPNPSGDSNPLTAPSLRSLKFLAPVNHFRNISSLLDRLDMPSLTQLVVECADGTGSYIAPNQDIMRSILGLFERSCCSLTLLKLCDVRTTSYDMRSLFIRLPNLEDLRLANVGNDTITNTILRELAVIDESPPAFPKLHTLHIDGAWGFKPSNFIKTVRSRCTLSTGYAQLRSVRVAWKAGVFDDMEDRAHAVASQLKDCEADGLELSSFVFSLLVPLD